MVSKKVLAKAITLAVSLMALGAASSSYAQEGPKISQSTHAHANQTASQEKSQAVMDKQDARLADESVNAIVQEGERTQEPTLAPALSPTKVEAPKEQVESNKVVLPPEVMVYEEPADASKADVKAVNDAAKADGKTDAVAVAAEVVATKEKVAKVSEVNGVTGATAVQRVAQAEQGDQFLSYIRGDGIDLQGAQKSYQKLIGADDKSQVFFARNKAYKQLDESFTKLSEGYQATLAVALLDKDGLALLKNNDLFPLLDVADLHIAYAVARKMDREQIALDEVIKVKVEDLRNDPESPLLDVLKRRGELKEAQDGSLVATKSGQKDLAQESIDLKLSELLYFCLGTNDKNAGDILVSKFLGRDELNKFLLDLGLENTKINAFNYDVVKNSDLAYENTANLFDVAKLSAIFLKDKSLPENIRDHMDQSLLLTLSDSTFIQDGIISSFKKDPNNTASKGDFKILEKAGVGQLNPLGQCVGVSDMVYFEYQGQPYLMAIFAKNIKGNKAKSINQGEHLVRDAATAIFDVIRAGADLKK